MVDVPSGVLRSPRRGMSEYPGWTGECRWNTEKPWKKRERFSAAPLWICRCLMLEIAIIIYGRKDLMP